VPYKEILFLLDSSLSFCLNRSSESFWVVFPDFEIFFECVLDMSLSLCRRIHVPLSCVSPTSLVLAIISLWVLSSIGARSVGLFSVWNNSGIGWALSGSHPGRENNLG
jgi:hypothetical protein